MTATAQVDAPPRIDQLEQDEERPWRDFEEAANLRDRIKQLRQLVGRLTAASVNLSPAAMPCHGFRHRAAGVDLTGGHQFDADAGIG